MGKSPFDELGLIKESVAYLKDKLRCEVSVKYSDEASDDHQQSAATAQPGKPAVHFTIEGGGKPAAGGKAAAGGAKAKAGGKADKPAENGAAKKAAASSFKPITDLKKLNELM